jgi:hypothetical protein
MPKRRRCSVKLPMGARKERHPPGKKPAREPRGLILAIPAAHHRLRLAVAPKGGAGYRRVSLLGLLREKLFAVRRRLGTFWKRPR